uniref:Uncharacterized protein n=1 Tax=Zooxanthella nutricula TaxID=1333877 RepID=A0A7S2KGP6_9DINO
MPFESSLAYSSDFEEHSAKYTPLPNMEPVAEPDKSSLNPPWAMAKAPAGDVPCQSITSLTLESSLPLIASMLSLVITSPPRSLPIGVHACGRFCFRRCFS